MVECREKEVHEAMFQPVLTPSLPAGVTASTKASPTLSSGVFIRCLSHKSPIPPATT